jgi:hypothetical protein
MKQRKALSRRHLGSTLNARPPFPPASAQTPLYGISPKYPGKLVQRLPDGTELVGTFQNGTFVPELPH